MNLLFANDRRGAYPASWYAASAAPLAAFPALQGTAQADVCVIGGGYTGLSAALHLVEKGLRVMLLEAQRVGFGASGRNGGQVGSGQRLPQSDLEALVGPARARILWDFGQEAKALVQALILRHAMPLTWRPGIVHACWHDSEVRHAHANVENLRRNYGYDQIEALDRATLHHIVRSDVYRGGEVDHGAGHINPLVYALGFATAAAAAGVRICEASEVTGITHGAKPLVRTVHGEVRCQHVILACNGYLGGLAPSVAAKVMPINNYIVATEPLGDRAADVLAQDVAVADTKFVVNYFRLSEDRRLLFGGIESYGYRFPRNIAAAVRVPMVRVFPQLKSTRIDHAWGGTLAITRSRLPCFSRVKPNVFNASGYSGHGVALATLAGKLLAEAVIGQTARFDVMADLPNPSFPGGAALRWPLLVAGMSWYALRDRLAR